MHYSLCIYLFFFVLMSFGSLSAQMDSLEVIEKNIEVGELLNANQYRKAKDILQHLYIQDQQNVGYLTKIAFCDYQLGSFGDARLYFKEALKYDSLNAFSISYLGLMADQNQHYDEAQSYYQQLIQIDSTNSYYYKQNGYIAKKREAYYEAVAFFNLAYHCNELDLITISELCKLYIGLKQYDYADYMIAEGYKIDSTNINILQHRIQSNFDQKRYAQTILYGNKCLALGDTSLFYIKMMGFANIKLDSFQNAVNVLHIIEEKAKEKELIYYYLATAYSGLKQPDQAIEYYEKATEAGISKKVPLYYKNIGLIYETENQLKKALKAYENAYFFSKEPIYLYYMARDADNYYKDKKIALRYYEKYLKSNDPQYRDYVKERISYLKEQIHLSAGK